ncbi:MAG: hypothetical protein AAF092_10580 [Pseudomonadota bacterium]
MTRKKTTQSTQIPNQDQPQTDPTVNLGPSSDADRPDALGRIGIAQVDVSDGDDPEAPVVLDAAGEPPAPPVDPAKEAAAFKGSQQLFYEAGFKNLFNGPMVFLGPAYAPVAVQESEEETARKASDAVHDVLHKHLGDFLPSNERWGPWMAIIPFVGAKVWLGWMIYNAEKAKAAAQTQPHVAADTAGPQVPGATVAPDFGQEWELGNGG